MNDKDYEDGYKEGISFAEQDFRRWQDEGCPPFPWPRVASDVRGFVEGCLPIMRRIFNQNIVEDAFNQGVDPKYISYIPIPRKLIEGQDNGYRVRLTELLNKVVKLYGTPSLISVMIIPPHISPVRRFAPNTPFVLARAKVPTNESGLARNDGTFTASLIDIGENVVMFPSANAAIAWAEASPRNWEVVNKAMF